MKMFEYFTVVIGSVAVLAALYVILPEVWEVFKDVIIWGAG